MRLLFFDGKVGTDVCDAQGAFRSRHFPICSSGKEVAVARLCTVHTDVFTHPCLYLSTALIFVLSACCAVME